MPLSSFSQTELVLTRRPRMDRPLMWTVWISAATFSIAEGQWFYLFASSFGVAVNMFAVSREKEVYVHRYFVNLGVAAATAILGVEIFATKLTLLQAMGHYLILLQLCKLFQQKRNRDYVQILSLSGLLMIASAMITNEVWYAVAVVAYVLLLCRTAMVFTLKRGLDAIAEAKLSTDPQLAEVSQVAWNVSRAWPKLAIRRRTYLVVAFVIATGVLVFLIAPRSQIVDPKPLVGSGTASRYLARASGAGATGFAGRVVLGDVVGPIYQSVERKMTVRLIPPPGKGETASALYLCGAIFGSYAGSQWFRAPNDPEQAGIAPEPPIELLDQAIIEEVVMDASLLPAMFASLPVIYVGGDQEKVKIRPDTSIRGPMAAPPGHIRYEAHCLAYPLPQQAKQYLAAYRDHYGTGPSEDPTAGIEVTAKVRTLAEEWCADLLDRRRQQPERKDQIDREIATRIETKLEQTYVYTLDLTGADPSRDGVEDFLFNMKRGHCEYFASAMVVMCRALGVHARLVTGFVMSEYDTDEGVYIVRGRDAHAWTEIYTPSTDWIDFDPSPPGGRRLHQEVWGSSARRRWNDIKFVWYEKVVGYDASTRNLVWKTCKHHLSVSWQSLKKLVLYGEIDRGMVHLVLIIGTIGLIIEGILVTRWVRAAVRGRRIRSRRLPIPPNQVGFVRELVKLLAQKGVKRRADQTLAELAADAIAAGLPAEPISQVIDLYYRIRWGRRIPTLGQLQDAKQKVDELRQKLR